MFTNNMTEKINLNPYCYRHKCNIVTMIFICLNNYVLRRIKTLTFPQFKRKFNFQKYIIMKSNNGLLMKITLPK